MAQLVLFQGNVIKINPKDKKELLIKKGQLRSFNLLKNFEVNIHYVLSSKYLIVVFTENGFYSTLDVFSDDWQNFV